MYRFQEDIQKEEKTMKLVQTFLVPFTKSKKLVCFDIGGTPSEKAGQST